MIYRFFILLTVVFFPCLARAESDSLAVFERSLQALQESPTLETYYTKTYPLFQEAIYLLALDSSLEGRAEIASSYAAKFQEELKGRYSQEELEEYDQQHKANLSLLEKDSEGFLSQINEAIWSQIEECLVPIPEGSGETSLEHYLPLAPLFPLGLGTLAADCSYRIFAYGFSWFAPSYWLEWVEGDPEADFACVLKDSRNWEKLGDLSSKITLGQHSPNFQWGVATCTLQDSPIECEHSQWRNWDREIGGCIEENKERFEKASLMGLYKTPEGRKELSDRLHKLGLNAYRFSLAWSEIEPEEGIFNEEMIQLWVNLCKHLRDEGIAPMISLHHFSEPMWFHEKGSFEKEENVPYFIRFVRKVVPHLIQDYNEKPLVDHICTINEVNTEGLSRFIRGAFSPGVVCDFARGGEFMKTMLKAHQEAYNLVKGMNPEIQVGIVHQRIDFHPTNILMSPITRYLSRFVNEVVMNAFKTDTFELEIPFVAPYLLPGCHIREEGMGLKTDFIGLQYYVRPLIGQTGSTTYHAPMTNMPFREDPEGLYEAIIEAYEAFGVPVIVTENGISTKDSVQRNRYNQRALYAMQRAGEKIGSENLLGYYYWCMTNNYEWDMGLDQFFGAFDVDAEGNLATEPKPGMDTFREVTHSWHQAVRSAAQ